MTEIRSYRNVFDLERRIYRVDRLRLNPGGVPLRGIVYFLAIFAVTLLAGRLPVVGVFARTLPWYVRELALPGAVSGLLTLIKIEGRASLRGSGHSRRPTGVGAHMSSWCSRMGRTRACAACATPARARCSSVPPMSAQHGARAY
jgi:hypothetical protein